MPFPLFTVIFISYLCFLALSYLMSGAGVQGFSELLHRL